MSSVFTCLLSNYEQSLCATNTAAVFFQNYIHGSSQGQFIVETYIVIFLSILLVCHCAPCTRRPKGKGFAAHELQNYDDAIFENDYVVSTLIILIFQLNNFFFKVKNNNWEETTGKLGKCNSTRYPTDVGCRYVCRLSFAAGLRTLLIATACP